MHVYCVHLHIPFQIKAIWEKGSGHSPLEGITTPFSTKQQDCVRDDFFLIRCGQEEFCKPEFLPHYHISFHMGISTLTNFISVGDNMSHHPVFGCVVLIFILDYQEFLGIEISFSLLLSSKFYLVSLQAGLIFYNFNKPHPAEESPESTAHPRPAGPVQLWWGWGMFRIICFLSVINK